METSTPFAVTDSMGVVMSEIARATYYRQLKQELDSREHEARLLAAAAEKLERDGQTALAEGIRDMWRYNEVGRLRIQTQLGALFFC
jgi:uncharacterized protein (DUF2126 family)